MKRKSTLKLHIIATAVALFTISSFFIISLYAEIKGDQEFIKTVKSIVLYCLPILLMAMPTLSITGNTLAGKSKNVIVLKKLKRMKLVMFNGIILVSLAIFLYYRSHYIAIDSTFMIAQITEFIFGLSNLTLIGLNARLGLKLSRRI
ncbi:hypothetical protein [Flammeovirga kamogawensis]|uniref:DUF4293 family protein n=1 Tax=Flammeovirga kamogawensis TaxID=373891 RepID=A0ABX8H5V0_9BACT|nr:hypothetical protein [Flammeovirga kamogawensis]MBB6463506.1 hypothetical protein [Flammeovirga kamogawensis]QWG10565.1 hypothetical protein KM029_24590 [Flammeovirga kamogawensis]TRX63671.1 hypothetical protein EO216_24975 [Flammeovirga kamogawensis]